MESQLPVHLNISRPSFFQGWEQEHGPHDVPLHKDVVVGDGGGWFLFNSPGEGLCFPGGGGVGGGRLLAHSRQLRLFLNCRLPGVIGKSEV